MPSLRQGRTKLAVAVVAALGLLAGCGQDDAQVTASGQGASAPPDPASVTEFLNRENPSTVWTAEGLFVYGGSLPEGERPGPIGGAAILDPAGELPDLLPPPPLDHPLASYATLATASDDVFLMGVQCGDQVVHGDELDCLPGTYAAAIYSLPEREWRSAPIPEALHDVQNGCQSYLGVTSDTAVVLELGRPANQEPLLAPFWTFTLSSQDWIQLPDPGVRIDDVCLAGDHLVVVTSAPTGVNGTGGTTTQPELRVLDLGQEDPAWESTPAGTGVEYNPFPVLACGDDFVLAHGGLGDEALVHRLDDLQSGWVEPPPLPDEQYLLDDVWTGEELLLLNTVDGVGYALNAERTEWRPIESPRQPFPRWTGTGLAQWDSTTPNGLALVDISP